MILSTRQWKRWIVDLCNIINLGGYVSSTGACRGGARPANNAGLRFFGEKDCMTRCETDYTCTGYNVPVPGENWCETFTSKGATGDGRTAYKCYMKGKRKP